MTSDAVVPVAPKGHHDVATANEPVEVTGVMVDVVSVEAVQVGTVLTDTA